MPLTVSKEVLCEIGRITVWQSHIEGQMALFIRELLCLDEASGNLITFKLRVWDLIDLLGSLLTKEFSPTNKHVERFEEFRQAMSKIVPQRNVDVHSMWGFGHDLKSDSATRVKVVKHKTKGAVLKSVPVSLEELRKRSKEMEHLEWLISDIRVRVCHYEADARQVTRIKASVTQ